LIGPNHHTDIVVEIQYARSCWKNNAIWREIRDCIHRSKARCKIGKNAKHTKNMPIKRKTAECCKPFDWLNAVTPNAKRKTIEIAAIRDLKGL